MYTSRTRRSRSLSVEPVGTEAMLAGHQREPAADLAGVVRRLDVDRAHVRRRRLGCREIRGEVTPGDLARRPPKWRARRLGGIPAAATRVGAQEPVLDAREELP